MSETRKALIIANKEISTSPRVLKEISWLSQSGWIVDTLGYGFGATTNGTHTRIGAAKALTRYLIYFVRHKRLRFFLLYERFLPQGFESRLKNYDLVVIHDLTLLPSRVLRRVLESNAKCKVHIDLHEDHIHSLSRNSLERFAFEAYRVWELGHLKPFVSSLGSRLTISSVSKWISGGYSAFLGTKVFTIRNAPENLDISPSRVNPDAIELVHHGVGTLHRGIESAIFALTRLPRKYSLNFYLVAGPTYLFKVKLLAWFLGVADRTKFHLPVPTVSISREINKHDVALVVIPPITENEMQALPNKFLESLQARLAIISGPNPAMATMVNQYKLGVLLSGWSTDQIVAAVSGLTADEISEYKRNADRNSQIFSSVDDRNVFLSCVN
jgi:glycosyltransferase involved in cell wall biosynthesis